MQFQLSWLELKVVEYGVYSLEHDIAKRATVGDVITPESWSNALDDVW